VNRCLAVIVLGAVEDEKTFWIQLLMVVILATGVGIYGLVKSRVKRIKLEAHDEIIETIIEPPKPLVKKRNLSGGMELLARNFLAGVVEQTGSSDPRDIEMRRLCFAELVRRGELWALASNALKVYTLDEGGFYGKVIRCEQWRNWPDGPIPAKTPLRNQKQRMSRATAGRINRHRMPPTPYLLSKTARDWKQRSPKGQKNTQCKSTSRITRYPDYFPKAV